MTAASALVRQFGRQCWELDALRPAVIADLIRTELKLLIDQRAWRKSPCPRGAWPLAAHGSGRELGQGREVLAQGGAIPMTDRQHIRPSIRKSIAGVPTFPEG